MLGFSQKGVPFLGVPFRGYVFCLGSKRGAPILGTYSAVLVWVWGGGGVEGFKPDGR